ncbi:zinc finger protein 160-like [Lineus longissimus]|uniref:zinc finger protein 160-like n=1 Tax=Lineus longissimus TaxID=88925 RepID=UPI00315D90D2
MASSQDSDIQINASTSGLNTRSNSSTLENDARRPELRDDVRKDRRVSVSDGHTIGNIHHWVVTFEPNVVPSQEVGYLGLTEGLCDTVEGDDCMHYIGPDTSKVSGKFSHIDSTDAPDTEVPPIVCSTGSTSQGVISRRDGNITLRGSTMHEGNYVEGADCMHEGKSIFGGTTMREGNNIFGGDTMREGNIESQTGRNCINHVSGGDDMLEGNSQGEGNSMLEGNSVSDNDMHDGSNENIIHERTSTSQRNSMREENSMVELEGNSTPCGGNMTSDQSIDEKLGEDIEAASAEGITDKEPRDVEGAVPEHFLSSLQLMTKAQDKMRQRRKPLAIFSFKLRPKKILKKQVFTSIEPRPTKHTVTPDGHVDYIKPRPSMSTGTPGALVGSITQRSTKSPITSSTHMAGLIKPQATKIIKDRQLDPGDARKTVLMDIVSPGVIGSPGRDEINWDWPQDSEGADLDQGGTKLNMNKSAKTRKSTFGIHKFNRTPHRRGSKSTPKKTDLNHESFAKNKTIDEKCKPCCVDLGKRVSDEGVERQAQVGGEIVRGESSLKAGSEVERQPCSKSAKVGQRQPNHKVGRGQSISKVGRRPAKVGRGQRFVVGGAQPSGERMKRDSGDEMTSFPCKYCKKSFRLKSQLTNHTCPDRKDQVLAEALKLMTERQKTSNISLAKKIVSTRRSKGHILEDTVNKMSDRRTVSQVKTERDLESPNSMAGPTHTKRLSLVQKYDRYRLKQFGCAHCKVVFLRKDNLLKHLLIHSGNRPFGCQVCEMKFLRKDQLVQHERIHTGEKPFRCETCSKSFLAKGNLKRHELTHAADKPFKCDRCNEAFIREFQLDVHKRIHSGKKPFRCQMCRKGFRCAVTLNIHQRSHTGETPYVCGQCDKAFKQKQSLSKHEFLVHGVKREHTFECGHCEREFMCRSDLTKHAVVHTEERPFVCLIQNCGKRFRKKFHLMRHELTHTGDKPFKCEICQKRFASSGSLKKHERIHTGEKPFKCSYCVKVFAQKVGLQQHERIHTGDKPYQCSHCKMAFAQRSNLLSHERVHTGKKPYECGYCHKAFAARSNMKRHEMTHENGAGGRNIKEESETDLSEWSE